MDGHLAPPMKNPSLVSLDLEESENVPIQSPESIVTRRHSFDRPGNAADFWLPSVETQNTLQTRMGETDKRLCYTMPGISSAHPMGDPIAELNRKLGDTSLTRSIPRVEASIAGLTTLIAEGHFRSAIDLTATILAEHGQGLGKAHTPSKISPEIIELVAAEMEPFGNFDSPDLYYQYYTELYRRKKGSMIPFSMRLLHAELPKYTNNHTEAAKRCYNIINTVKQMLTALTGLTKGDDKGSVDYTSAIGFEVNTAAVELWQRRLTDAKKCLARVFYSMRDYHLAAVLLNEVADCPSLTAEDRADLYSLLGRIHLQQGDQVSAAAAFQKFNASCDQSSPRMKSIACMHKAFLNVFYGSYAEATQAFQIALQYQPDNYEAANNLGVCELYGGGLSTALQTLEQRCLHAGALREAVCTNLCTLYELNAAATTATSKTALLAALLAQRGDLFDAGAVKL